MNVTGNDPTGETFVACRLCEKEFRIISTQHLAVHGLTRGEYLEKFELTSEQLVCRERRYLNSKRSDYEAFSDKQLRAKILKIYKTHGKVSGEFVKANWYPVYDQARRIHGDWFKALSSLGLETWQMAKNKEWTREKVLKELRSWHKKQGHLHRVSRTYGPLPWFAEKHFESWEDAVKKAGFSLKEAGYMQKQEWNREKVLKTIQRYKKRSNFSKTNFLLLRGACIRYFSTVESALDAAGISWTDFYETNRWSREIVIEELKKFRRKYGKKCSPIAYKANPVLNLMAVKYVGSWNEALRLAGIEPAFKKWTSELVVSEIRRLLKNGALPTNAGYIQKKSSATYAAAKKQFGSWENAVRAAGMEFKPLR
jgi:hypothetical protein